MDVEASTDPKKPKLDPLHSGGENSTTKVTTVSKECAPSESEQSTFMQVKEITKAYPSDEDGESSSSGEDEEEDEEEEGSDMRTQV